jgi:transposase
MKNGELRSQTDKLWTECWTGGIANPLMVIEQISFLIFARMLDIREAREENQLEAVISHFAKDPPSPAQGSEFYATLLCSLLLWEDDKTDAGRPARRIVGQIDSLWYFLDHESVEPTNNRAEPALRFGVLWRKRSLGRQSKKGNRCVERILSIKKTCRLKVKCTFQALVQCIDALFNHTQPNLSWI